MDFEYLEDKYLLAVAESFIDIRQEAEEQIVNCFRLFVDSAKTNKNPIFHILASLGSTKCQEFITAFEELVATLKSSNAEIFIQINNILKLLTSIKTDVREEIYDSIVVSRKADKNFVQHNLQKLEKSTERILSILQKQRKIFHILAKNDNADFDETISTVNNTYIPKQVSEQQLFMFKHMFNIDDEVMARLLEVPEVRKEIQRLIYLKSKHLSFTVKNEIANINKLLSRKINNTQAFEPDADIIDPQYEEAQDKKASITDIIAKYSNMLQLLKGENENI